MNQKQLSRVRKMCLALPEVSERLSHSAETFFAGKKVFAYFLDNHHGDGRLAIWIPAPAGMQAALIAAAPATYFRPPYVGYRGWIGILLREIDDEELGFHLRSAWELVAPKRLLDGLPANPAARSAPSARKKKGGKKTASKKP